MTYYDDKLEQGKKYEQFIVKELEKIGISINLTKSYREQIEIGESFEGYEIKFDDKFQDTNNLWIEIYERTDINLPYVKSGILRDDNTIRYVIGNYLRFFIFNKETLTEILHKYEIKENNRKTSKGFLLSENEAILYAEQVINPVDDGNETLDRWA